MGDATEVLVVGAGPTGLTLAAGLLKRGIRVRVVDRAERANPHSKAITLWPRALEAFDALGVGQEMFDLGVKLRAANYYTGDRPIGRLRMRPLSGTRFPVPISLPQNTTERLLREAVEQAGGRIEYGRKLVSLRQDDDAVVADLADGERITASWLVGCDGAHSTVREQIGVRFDGATYPQTFVLVDGEFDTAYAHDESYYLMGRAGIIVVVGLPGGLYRVFASVPPGKAVDDAVETVRGIARQHSPLRLELVEAAGSGVFQVHRKLAAAMRAGRVLLAGDAAHIHSPAGGLGLNTGVQDAHSAAWRLAGILRTALPAGELDAWEAERLFVAEGVVAEADRQTRMWMWSGWRRRLRDAAIDAGLRSGVMERVLPRRISQMDLVLPSPNPPCGRLRPGARLPDLALDSGRRLHESFSAGGHVLLVLGTAPDAVLDALEVSGRLLPPEVLRIVTGPGRTAAGTDWALTAGQAGRLRRALRAPREAVCLVRPDGVIASAARLSDAAGIGVLRTRLRQLTGEPEPSDPHHVLQGEK